MDSAPIPTATSQPPVTSPSIPELPTQPEKLLPAASGGSWGAFVGIVIIIIVLIVGALYFWGAQLEKQDEQKNAAAGENTDTGKSVLSDVDKGLDGF